MWSLTCFSSFIGVIILSITTEIVQSKYVFHQEIQRGISVHKQVATWEEAKQHCASEGAVLASPIHAELLKFIKTIITVHNHTTPYFIGIKAKHDPEVQFISQEGILLEDMPWALDMIEQLDSRNGDCLSMDGYSIRVVPCWTRMPYICYTNVTEENASETTTMEIPTTTPTDCNTGYKLDTRTGSYYKIYGENAAKSWDAANSTCNDEGGYLAILNDAYEARIVMFHIMGEGNIPFTWIGIRDRTGEDDWYSVHGEPLINLYNIFDQSRNKNNNNCMVLRFNGKLDKWLCSDPLPFICEKH